jgi:hypothetical protein
MELSAASKSKKIRDYAVLILPPLLESARLNRQQTKDLVEVSWLIAEEMYLKEVETYDRVMQEAGYTAHTPVAGKSAIGAPPASTTAASLKSAPARISRGSEKE